MLFEEIIYLAALSQYDSFQLMQVDYNTSPRAERPKSADLLRDGKRAHT